MWRARRRPPARCRWCCQSKTREDFVTAAGWARGIAGGNGKLGAVGFCYGGGMVNFLATRMPELLAGARPRFDAAAAQLAWGRAVGLFNRTLR